MKKKILSYHYSWNLSENIGYLQFQFEKNGKIHRFKVTDKAEFLIIITMLQNKSPVFMRKSEEEGTSLATFSESIGKEEYLTLQEFIEKL